LPTGSLAIVVCAEAGRGVRGASRPLTCRRIGTLRVGGGTITTTATATTTNSITTATTSVMTTSTTTPASSVPADPVRYVANTPLEISNPGAVYWVDVPASYDASNQTPMTLFVWLHGCGGYSMYDIEMVDPGADRDYLSIAVGGRRATAGM
jgi:hypothetical protein